MYHVGVLGRLDGNIASCIEKLDSLAESVITCCDSEQRLSGRYDFIFVSQEFAESLGEIGSAVSESKILLVPGKFGARISSIISSGCIVTYGLSAKDTITLSSIEDKRGVIAVQREMLSIEGIILERQEFPVNYELGMIPETVMEIVGTLLILGVSAESISQMKFSISNKNKSNSRI